MKNQSGENIDLQNRRIRRTLISTMKSYAIDCVCVCK